MSLRFVLLVPVLASGVLAETESHRFTPPADLPGQAGLPDPFLKPDGSRVQSMSDWPAQRAYLKEMLAHYQYGHMPPRPKEFDLRRLQEENAFDGGAVWERYAMTLKRKGKSLTFHFELIRPPEKKRMPVIIKNGRMFFDESETGANDRTAARHAVRRGYLLCKFQREEVAADRPGNRGRGVFALYPEYDWGTIAAWAWTHGIVLDALDRLALADLGRVIATGHSRGGKTALCAGIYDERVAITAPNSSGTGGTGGLRHFEDGQRPQRLGHHRKRFDHWWVPRFFEFADREDRIPFDAHTAKVLVAPRALVNAHARGDYWANPYGTELTFRAANPVFTWLGAKDKQGLHWREGGHAQNEEDWLALLDFADREFFGKQTKRSFSTLAYPDAKVPVEWKTP